MSPPSLDPLYVELVEFQIERLRRTYRDFVEDPTYTRLTRFFFEDVYSTLHKARRDEQIRRLHAKVQDRLGDEVIRNLDKVIELNELTDQLDFRLAGRLKKTGVQVTFTESEYEEAYYLCDDYADRQKQIDLILHSLAYFHGLAQYRSLGIGLKLLRPYALIKRATLLLNFLQAGYKAFRSVKTVDHFAHEVKQRETERLNRIYSLGRKVPSVGELRRRGNEMGIRGADNMELRKLMREMAQWV